MAIFGLRVDKAQACREALTAAQGIERRMAALNVRMKREFGSEIECGIGLDPGQAAIGEVGYRDPRIE
jgi:adenylate cyclase